MISEPGELVNKTMPIVFDKKGPKNYNGFDVKGGIFFNAKSF